MNIRTLLILFILPFCFISYGQSTINSRIALKEFTENPWLFEPTISAIQETYGEFLKTEKYTVKNRFSPEKKDTIIRFHKGKTEIFFYRPINGNPFFIAANLYDKRISLKGNVAPGISSQEFFSKVNFPENKQDTIKMYLPEGAYKTFIILKDNIINHIKIEARNKNH